MNAHLEGVSLTHDPAPEGVSLTVSLADLQVDGYKWTKALVKDESGSRKKGASRQKKLEDKKRDEGLKRAYVPVEILELAERLGWSEVVGRAQRERASWWKFWGAKS